MDTEFTTQNGGEPSFHEQEKLHVKRARRTFSRYFLGLFVYVLNANLLLVAAEIVSAFLLGAEKTTELFNMPVVILGSQVLFSYIIGLGLFYLIVRTMPTEKRWVSATPASDLGVYYLIGIGLMQVGSLIGTGVKSLLTLLTGQEITDSTSDLISETPIWLIFLVIVILAPLVEELLFRKLLLDRISFYGDRLALVVSAVSFGIFHGNFSQVFYATLVGFLLAYVYLRSGRLRDCYLIHAAINFTGSILPMLLQKAIAFADGITDEQIEARPALNALLNFVTLETLSYLAVIFGLAVAGIVLLVRKRKEFRLDSSSILPLPKEKVWSVILLNVGVILFLLFCALEFALDVVPLSLG